MVVWSAVTPRSASMSSRSRQLTGNWRYQRTTHKITSAGKRKPRKARAAVIGNALGWGGGSAAPTRSRATAQRNGSLGGAQEPRTAPTGRERPQRELGAVGRPARAGAWGRRCGRHDRPTRERGVGTIQVQAGGPASPG